MTNDLGAELIDLLRDFNLSTNQLSDALNFSASRSQGLDVGPSFDIVIARALALQQLALQPSDGTHAPIGLPDSPPPSPTGLILYLPAGHYTLGSRASGAADERHPYDIPANVQLYFCPGALLRPAADVDVVIRGSVFAGLYQIFGTDHYHEATPSPTGDTPPAGRIIFAGDLVPALYPEWWGAWPNPDLSLQFDSAPAIQAAIDAACVTRDYAAPTATFAPARPSLPVLLSGPYYCHRTLSVNADPTQAAPERHLILRGQTGFGTTGRGIPTLARFRNPTLADDETDGCLLRLGPNVSFEFEGIIFSINEEDGAPLKGQMRPRDRRVSGCIDLVGDDDGVTPRRGVFRRCSVLGGQRYALRVRAAGETTLRHVHVVDGGIYGCTVNWLSLYGLEVKAGHSALVHVENTGLPVSSADIGNTRYPTLGTLPDNAAVYLRGGSVLLQACGFVGAPGPRPSRGNTTDVDSIRLGDPDGQEVFLAPGDDGRSSTHLTAMHVECQGWWFLSRPHAGDDQVVLLNVAHVNIQWGNGLADRYYKQLNGPDAVTPGTAPPTVVWLGSGGRCVLVGCAFASSMLTDADGYPQIIDVGVVFRRGDYRTAAGLGEQAVRLGYPPFRWDPRLLPAYPPGAIDPVTGNPPDPLNVNALDSGEHFRPVSEVHSIPRPPVYRPAPLPEGVTYDFLIPHPVPRFTR